MSRVGKQIIRRWCQVARIYGAQNATLSLWKRRRYQRMPEAEESEVETRVGQSSENETVNGRSRSGEKADNQNRPCPQTRALWVAAS